MKKILIAGAGGAPSEGVIKSLLESKRGEEIIGMGSEPTDLVLSSAKRKYYVPYANSPGYKESFLKILKREKPDLVHFQNDLEVYHAAKFINEIHALGTKTFMPDEGVIDVCVDKFKTYEKLRLGGVVVPETRLIQNEVDLKSALADLADENGMVWLRSSSIGAGGKGALPTKNYELAKQWITHFNGWGEFCAAQMLTANSVTWLSIWFEGELVVAQSRIRKGWIHGNRTLSGVTGVTKVGQTYSDSTLDSIAINTIKAISEKPHGIFAVDLTYDKSGVPNPTEINISRFFTTVLFFTIAGLNMPEIFKDIALYNEFPDLEKRINPLPNGLLWLRGMDTLPRLIHEDEMANEFINLL